MILQAIDALQSELTLETILCIAGFLAFVMFMWRSLDGPLDEWNRASGRFAEKYGIPQNRVWADETVVGARRGLRKRSFNWTDVVEIVGVRYDTFSTEIVYLILKDAKGTEVILGEFDAGFEDVMAVLPRKIDGFPAEWLNVIGPYVDQFKVVWSR